MAEVFFKNKKEAVCVGTIYCIGRNYAAHASELNNPIPSAPIVFIKPATTLVHEGRFVEIPTISKDVHHEVEIVALIGKKGKHIPVTEAISHISGYGIGIDVTARDIQSQAKAKSHPWAVAKGFDTFAPVSEFVPAATIADPANINLSLSVNNKIRQSGNSQNMLFPISNLVVYLSTIFTLMPGDLIFTGTPKGVSQIQPGDVLQASLENGLVTLNVNVKRAGV